MASRLVRKPQKSFGAKHLEGTAPWMQIANKKPGYVYGLFDKSLGGQFGPGYYQAIGWEFVLQEKDGERFAAGMPGKDGDALEAQGLVLMRILKSKLDEIRVNGDGFSSQGLASHNATLEHIADQSSRGFNPIKGVAGLKRPGGGMYATVENQTTDLEPVFGE